MNFWFLLFCDYEFLSLKNGAKWNKHKNVEKNNKVRTEDPDPDPDLYHNTAPDPEHNKNQHRRHLKIKYKAIPINHVNHPHIRTEESSDATQVIVTTTNVNFVSNLSLVVTGRDSEVVVLVSAIATLMLNAD
jgi:hypothetical protein